jgi:hypothetical protein
MSEATPSVETQPESPQEPQLPPETHDFPGTASTGSQQDYLKMLPEEIQIVINGIKAKGVTVFMTFLGDRAYLFRTVNVIEWMGLQKAQEERSKAQGATEEFLQQALYEAIVLHANLGVVITGPDGVEKLLPQIDRDTIKGQPAGVPSSLAQQIMLQSGFDGNPLTVKL